MFESPSEYELAAEIEGPRLIKIVTETVFSVTIGIEALANWRLEAESDIKPRSNLSLGYFSAPPSFTTLDEQLKSIRAERILRQLTFLRSDSRLLTVKSTV